jgi:hypothetical protein
MAPVVVPPVEGLDRRPVRVPLGHAVADVGADAVFGQRFVEMPGRGQAFRAARPTSATSASMSRECKPDRL